MNSKKWDLRFLVLAEHIAQWSKDPSTKCGAVIARENKIISLGFNGFAKGCSDAQFLYNNRDLKYNRVIHAEPNAILTSNASVKGCSIYTWPFPPCSKCAALIIQSGITRVVANLIDNIELLERWQESLEIASDMYKEAEIDFILYDFDGRVF